MIKKFKGFYNAEFDESNKLLKYISMEDIEDHFLRLEEVFLCEVSVEIYSNKPDPGSFIGKIFPHIVREWTNENAGYYFMEIKIREDSQFLENTSEVEEEIENIKRRIMNMYPTNTNVEIEKNPNSQFITYMSVKLKENIKPQEQILEFKVKKFHQFNESIKDIISKEELEDHFLRLKQVFNCHIEIQYSPVYELYLVGIHGDKYHIKELEQIKKRIEYIYKGFKMCTIMKYENNKYVTVNYICDSEIGSARVRDILSRIRGDWKTLDYLKESVN